MILGGGDAGLALLHPAVVVLAERRKLFRASGMLPHELVDLHLACLPGLVCGAAIKARKAGGCLFGFGFHCRLHSHSSLFIIINFHIPNTTKPFHSW